MDSQKIKDALFLPKTNFPLKNANHLENEKRIRELWEEKKIYQQVLEKSKNNQTFILHSGPPYANGKIHLGHVLNFLIKDIIVRFYASQGYYTPFILGWDTHGLPIEHKVLQLFPERKNDLRKKCAEYASQQVEIQKKQLEQLGLFTGYDKIYLTKDKKYVAEQIRIFGEMVKKNLVYRGWKPIYWSCSHATALAEAEVEYYEKKDTSLYFKISSTELAKFFRKEKVYFLVWTTQPWTIPANQMVAVKETASYLLIDCDGEYLVVIEKMAYKLKKWGKSVKTERILTGKDLLVCDYLHPYNRKGAENIVVKGDEFIQEEEGTGIVHLAPAFGFEDFIIAKRNQERIFGWIECPLEPNGIFNEKIGVPELVGKHYKEVNEYVIADLEKRNLIVKKEVISHSYPHDWRDKTPLIYRLTEQWFINIQKIKPDLLKNIEKVKWHPSWTKEKMQQAISSRDDWCISRQRKWGVPIPVLFNENKPLLIPEIIDYIADIFEKNGLDCWFDGSILPLLQEKFPNLINKDTRLGTDIMDVWLDSGVSHWCFLRKEEC